MGACVMIPVLEIASRVCGNSSSTDGAWLLSIVCCFCRNHKEADKVEKMIAPIFRKISGKCFKYILIINFVTATIF